jgi:hypothetical protein
MCHIAGSEFNYLGSEELAKDRVQNEPFSGANAH